MKVGLIDVDGHHFPNLALMRISAWHKARGDEVVWWWSDFEHYDIVYMSKIFSDAYSKVVYCLTNYDSTMEENLHRIYTLRDLGYDPYVMIYDKPHAPREIRRLQRWCNNKWVFKKTPRFDDYL